MQNTLRNALINHILLSHYLCRPITGKYSRVTVYVHTANMNVKRVPFFKAKKAIHAGLIHRGMGQENRSPIVKVIVYLGVGLLICGVGRSSIRALQSVLTLLRK